MRQITLNLKISFARFTAFLFSVHLNAQTPTLEFASGVGNPAGNGPSLANQVITFQNDTNNPSGNSFATYSPTLTATYSLSNQQYTLPVSQISTGKGLNFGANQSNSSAAAPVSGLFEQMNFISSPSNSNFTSSTAVTAGTGIDIIANRAVSMFISVKALDNANAATSGRFYFGDVTIAFNQPVTNPIIHIVGLGGFYHSLGFTAELELQTSGIVLSKLSGSSELSVSSGTKILNSATRPNSPTGSGAASGSVLATGSGITSLTFRVYMRGDGNDTEWSGSCNHQGDVFLIGVSLNAPVIHSGNIFDDADGLADNKVEGAGTGVPAGTQLSDTRIVSLGKQSESAITILAYPNPASNEVCITIPANWQGKKVNYELFGNSGQMVIKNETISNNQTKTINVSKLAPGFYIVKVTCNNETVQLKIIKQ